MKGGEIIKIHKCAVANCNNFVKRPGVLCKSCMEKYIDYNYVISKCSECNKILDISEPDDYISKLILEKSGSRIFMSICESCFEELNKKPFDSRNIDPDDFKELDMDEDFD